MALTPLLPKYHPQDDFFISDVFDSLPIKNDMATMEHPFFTLKTQKDMRTLNYENGSVSVEILPSGEGLPSIFDKDILLYCASLFMAEINNGGNPPQVIRISIHDFLKATNKSTQIGGDAYKRFKVGLKRLRGCTITTTVKTGTMDQVDGFGMIDNFRFLDSNRVADRLVAVEIKLSDWFYNSLIAKEVLTIDPDYFRIRKPLERRIYEIARKHCGKKRCWQISLEKLHNKSGSVSILRRFRHSIRELEKSNHLPGYTISHDTEGDMVTFSARKNEHFENQLSLGGLDGLARPDLSSQIPPDLLEDVRKIVGTKLDYYDLWNQYNEWSGSKKAKNARAGFVGFCKKKLAQHFVT